MIAHTLIERNERLSNEILPQVGAYLINGGKVHMCKPATSNGTLLGRKTWQGKTRKVYAVDHPFSLNVKKPKAITSQHFSRG